MEDFFETRIDGIDGEIVGLFGVFDGIFVFHPSHTIRNERANLNHLFYLQDMVEPQQLSI